MPFLPCSSGTQEGMDVLERHYGNASNMTEEIQGLTQYVASGADLDHPAVKSFYSKWRKDSLVMLKWFGSIAANSPAKNAVSRLEKLENDPLFDKDIPNHLRASIFNSQRII